MATVDHQGVCKDCKGDTYESFHTHSGLTAILCLRCGTQKDEVWNEEKKRVDLEINQGYGTIHIRGLEGGGSIQSFDEEPTPERVQKILAELDAEDDIDKEQTRLNVKVDGNWTKLNTKGDIVA